MGVVVVGVGVVVVFVGVVGGVVIGVVVLSSCCSSFSRSRSRNRSGRCWNGYCSSGSRCCRSGSRGIVEGDIIAVKIKYL